jgi:hypothetical protein
MNTMNTKTTVAAITVDYSGTPVTADINEYRSPNGKVSYMVATEQHDGFSAMIYSTWYGHAQVERPVDDDMKWRARNVLLLEIDNQGGLNYMSK